MFKEVQIKRSFVYFSRISYIFRYLLKTNIMQYLVFYEELFYPNNYLWPFKYRL